MTTKTCPTGHISPLTEASNRLIGRSAAGHSCQAALLLLNRARAQPCARQAQLA